MSTLEVRFSCIGLCLGVLAFSSPVSAQFYNLPCERQAWTADANQLPTTTQCRTTGATFCNAFDGGDSAWGFSVPPDDIGELYAYSALTAFATAGQTFVNTPAMQLISIQVTPVWEEEYMPQVDTTAYVSHTIAASTGGQGNVMYSCDVQSYSTFLVKEHPSYPGGGANGTATVEGWLHIYLIGVDDPQNYYAGFAINDGAVMHARIAGAFLNVFWLGYDSWLVTGEVPMYGGGTEFYSAFLPGNSQLHKPFVQATSVGELLDCTARVAYTGAFACGAEESRSVLTDFKAGGSFTVKVTD
jgi:hypothetical protein